MDGSQWKVLTKRGPMERGMANHFSILALRAPWTYEITKRYDINRWTLRVGVGAQYVTGEEWINTSERMKRWSQSEKKCPVVDMTADGSKVWCCKEQYCIGTWNVTSTNQGKLEVVKQEMARVNIDILKTGELK